MNDEKIRVIVSVAGGVIQAARSDHQNIELVILDMDENEDAEEAKEMEALAVEYKKLPYAIY